MTILRVIRRWFLWLARAWRWRNRDMEKRALDLEKELVRIEYRAQSVRAREQAMQRLIEQYPPAAVAAVADVRGFGNLARIARRVSREMRVELGA